MLPAAYGRWFSEARAAAGAGTSQTRTVLDVGCGPRPTMPVDGARLVGVDINAEYVRVYARAGSGAIPGRSDCKRVGVVASAERLPFRADAFDECRCFGLFHHLPAEVAQAATREMVRCVKPGGLVSIIDNVWPRSAWLRPAAWLIRRLDRGEWVRSEAELSGLVSGAVAGRFSEERITYTLNGLELLLLQGRKLEPATSSQDLMVGPSISARVPPATDATTPNRAR